MIKLPAYINAASCISAEDTFDNDSYLMSQLKSDFRDRKSREPEFKNYIHRKYLRRMGRMVRMGVCTAKKTLVSAEVDNPNAILVGTGMGCLQDTEEFLKAIYTSDEQIASPNQFIQSTHNNVASQIAIMLGCHEYNFTYVHRGFSFESAMADAVVHLIEAGDEKRDILVGGVDELTDTYLTISDQLNRLKTIMNQPEMPRGMENGCPQGEGAAFFCVSNERGKRPLAVLDAIEMIYKPEDEQVLQHKVKSFISELQLGPSDIDLVLVGLNGSQDDRLLSSVMNSLFESNSQAVFKHLSGEYKTAGAFAYWLTAQILNQQIVPDFIKIGEYTKDRIRRVLIFNGYNGTNFSLALLRNVEV